SNHHLLARALALSFATQIRQQLHRGLDVRCRKTASARRRISNRDKSLSSTQHSIQWHGCRPKSRPKIFCNPHECDSHLRAGRGCRRCWLILSEPYRRVAQLRVSSLIHIFF
ncbi:hypothetical protein DFH06DRAFT_1301966, partial [Mycena polygramma]